MTLRTLITTGAVAALIGIAAGTTTAEARTVCNRWGDCWHERDTYRYPATLGVHFYGDDWRWRHRHEYHWRHDHDGRGYWRNGVWISF